MKARRRQGSAGWRHRRVTPVQRPASPVRNVIAAILQENSNPLSRINDAGNVIRREHVVRLARYASILTIRIPKEHALIAVEHLSRSSNTIETPELLREGEEGAPFAQQPVTILIVEDEGIVARHLQESLTRLGYHIAGVASEGAEAVALAEQVKPQLVVMDVGLRGDIDGIEAARLIQQRLHAPVIFLTGHSDSQTLQRAVAAGPLGYLVKPFQEVELRCAIEVAIHKHRADLATREREEALRRSAELLENLSLVDELTHLRNRRGFFELATQALKVARREHHALGLFFMDVNGLKGINDNFGHLTGDQALRDAAQVLRQTFRDSDILARMGGDEFVALAHVTRDGDALRLRLRHHLDEFNAASGRAYDLDLSIGATLVDVTQEDDFETLIARADAAMYENKRSRTAPHPSGA